MIASTKDQIVQVEDLLRFVGPTPAPAFEEAFEEALADEAPALRLAFNSKPLFASLLALLIFAPGCAGGAVFLMRADDRVPLPVAPRLNPPVVAKSDRLPPEYWNPDAVEMLLGPKAEARIEAAAAFEDPAFLAPMLIRGSITINAADAHSIVDAMALAPSSKPRRDVRRVKPAKILAEIEPLPEPPPPTLLEKLFGTRFN
ncbi:MAG: hypothetical protein ABWY18_02935 [Tardiphaga sp.]